MPSDYSIVITRPCTDAPDRYIAESSFGRRVNMTETCARVKSIPGAKCSESLGVARFDYGEWTVIVYRSGRIDLRKVRDKADALAAMADLEQMLGDAFEQGGNVLQK
jgi:ArsR family metal-binding transcriptional regulator